MEYFNFFNIVKLVTDEASNQFSPLFSENPLKHSRLKSHLCASTGVCSLLLLITHLRLLRASRSRNLSLLFAYRATSSPFYAHNKAPPKLPGHLCASTGICSLLLLITHSDCYALRVPAICPYYSHIVRLRRPFMLIIRHPRNFQDTFVQAQVYVPCYYL